VLSQLCDAETSSTGLPFFSSSTFYVAPQTQNRVSTDGAT